MKTLYININNEQIQLNDELEVLKHDLDSDFFFHLGEKIAKDCKVENENALITDFNTQENEEDYKQIIAQWNELKNILFSEGCEGKFELTLPNGYIHWLKFHPQYVSVYDRHFSHGEPTVITIDLEELYEDSIEDLQHMILRKLLRDDLYLEIDEIVFNDDAVTRKSPIVRTIKEKYEGVGFKTYKKWIEDNKENQSGNGDLDPQFVLNVERSHVCKINEDGFFPINGVILGETQVNEVKLNYVSSSETYTEYKTDSGIHFNVSNINNKFDSVFLDDDHTLPAKWKKQFGFDFGSKYKQCENRLLKKGFEIVFKDSELLICITPNKNYLIYYDFCDNEFYSVMVILNKCLYCDSNKFRFKNYKDSKAIPICKNCGKPYYPELLENYDDRDTNTPNCPNCSSDEVDDDGSDYLQYTCNDCGHNWGHDNTVECPECGSNDVENDGTDNLQFECNDCGHVWGDDDDDDDDHTLSFNDFFPVCGVTLNKTTVQDVERQKYRYAEIERCDDGLVIAWGKNGYDRGKGIQIRREKGCDVFTQIYMTHFETMFPEWSKLGFDWKLSYNDWILLFKKMGFTVIQTEEPRVESWENHPDYLQAKLVTISKDFSLKFELEFSYGKEGTTRYSQSTLYSISVYSKDYSFDYGGHIGKKTFYNIEDFRRKEPKKYL